MVLWAKIRTRLRQFFCKHIGVLGVPVVHGYDFLITKKICHLCGAAIRSRMDLDVVRQDQFPVIDQLG